MLSASAGTEISKATTEAATTAVVGRCFPTEHILSHVPEMQTVAGERARPPMAAVSLDALLTSLRPGGRDFESVCKWVLENVPEYRQRLQQVWLWDEWRVSRRRTRAGRRSVPPQPTLSMISTSSSSW